MWHPLGMCYALYLACSKPLPEVPWRPKAPAFHALPMHVDEEPVRQHLTHEHVFCLGSSAGCGCEFGYMGDLREGSTPEAIENENERAERAALVAYLEPLHAAGASIELYCCWSGDEGEAKEHSFDVTFEQLRERCFVERGLVRVSPSA